MEESEETQDAKKVEEPKEPEVIKREVKEPKDFKDKSNDVSSVNVWKIATVVIGLLLIISIFTNGFRFGSVTGGVVAELTAEEAADKAIKYINKNLLQTGTCSLKSVEDRGDLYNIKLDIAGREFDSYVTKDGALLFPSFVDLNEEPEALQAQEPANVKKSDKPSVELFVMSHCPYGTQAEKGLIPVLGVLGDKIDFELRFVNYAMHGEKEVKEQLNQYCIRRDQNEKLIPYLKCFLEKGDGEACLESEEIDTDKLEKCQEEADEEFKITENLEDRSSWSGGRFPLFLTDDDLNKKYGVRGSPTLVINGVQASSGRAPAQFLATICNAFNEAPEECETADLNSIAYGPGFGYELSGNDAAAAALCG